MNFSTGWKGINQWTCVSIVSWTVLWLWMCAVLYYCIVFSSSCSCSYHSHLNLLKIDLLKHFGKYRAASLIMISCNDPFLFSIPKINVTTLSCSNLRVTTFSSWTWLAGEHLWLVVEVMWAAPYAVSWRREATLVLWQHLISATQRKISLMIYTESRFSSYEFHMSWAQKLAHHCMPWWWY